MRRLLRELATRARTGGEGTTAQTLAAALGRTGAPAAMREITDALRHLEEVGTVVGERAKDAAAPRWRISAPLLAEHLRSLCASGIL